MTHPNGMNTLGFQLDALEACNPKIPEEHLVAAIGSSAVQGLVHAQFRLNPDTQNFREIVATADRALDAPSALISIIRQCRAYHDPRKFPDVQQTGQRSWRYELVGSLVLAKNSEPRRYKVGTDRNGVPDIEVGEDGTGHARLVPTVQRKTPYTILFAPFSEQYPPREAVEARTAPRAQALFIALSGGEHVVTVEGLDAAEEIMRAQNS